MGGERGEAEAEAGSRPSRASVSGEREEDEAGSAGDGSRASVGAAAPQRWRPSRGGVAAPTRRPLRARVRPTSQYRASLLAPRGVTRAEAGPMGDGDRAEGRNPSFFFFCLFFLSHKMGRREGGERPASGDAAARLQRAPRDAAGRWAGLRAGRVLVRGGGRGRRGQVPGAGWAARSRCSGYYPGHHLPFQPLETRVHIPGERGVGSDSPLRTLEILMSINVFKIRPRQKI